MRRDVLHKSISKIINDLETCDILSFFKIMLTSHQRESKNGNNIPLTIFQKYMIATSNYDENEITVCEIIGIGKLLDVQFWQSLSEPDSANPEETHAMFRNVQFATNQLPKLLNLTKQDFVLEIKEQKEGLPEELKGKSLLTVLIVEDKGQFSSPLRLTSALGAIADLYSVVATIEKESENDLIVLACDSGSDKSFDFLGLAKVMEEVKEIIIAIWDRRVFHRQRHVSESLSLIAESLPILEKIEQLRENGSIEKEQAELLKRKTIHGATQFIEAGAIIPEFEGASAHNPKQLMKPEPKLLVSPWADTSNADDTQEEKFDNESSDIDSSGTEELSSEESEMLELLLKKSRTKAVTNKSPKQGKQRKKNITKK